jgi:hypothetical protein
MQRTETRGRKPIDPKVIEGILKDAEAAYANGKSVFTYTEIAERNGVSVGTVCNYVRIGSVQKQKAAPPTGDGLSDTPTGADATSTLSIHHDSPAQGGELSTSPQQTEDTCPNS